MHSSSDTMRAWLLPMLLPLLLLAAVVAGQTTYQRACECEYTRNGKCAYTVMTPMCPAGGAGAGAGAEGGGTEDKANNLSEDEIESLRSWIRQYNRTEWDTWRQQLTRMRGELSDVRTGVNSLETNLADVQSNTSSVRETASRLETRMSLAQAASEQIETRVGRFETRLLALESDTRHRLETLDSLVSDVQHSLDALQLDAAEATGQIRDVIDSYALCARRGPLVAGGGSGGGVRASSGRVGLGASDAGIHANGAWCADPGNRFEAMGDGSGESGEEPNSDYEWVQFDLGSRQPVYGVITLGRGDYGQWVTSYKLQYADEIPEQDDQGHWQVYTDVMGGQMVFEGNVDKNTPQTNMLWQPIHARYVRIWPISSHSNNICMRADIIVCVDQLT